MSTSNGLITPSIPNLNRCNTAGPNGIIPRNDVVYQQPMPLMAPGATRPNYHAAPANAVGVGPTHVILPPTSYPITQGYQFYTPPPGAASNYPIKRRIHCSNCGLPNHTFNECPEPFDSTSGRKWAYHKNQLVIHIAS